MKTIVQAKNVTEVAAASDFVVDATLILSSARFDEAVGTLDVAFEQTMFDEGVLIDGSLVKRHKAPRYLFNLHIGSAKRLEIEDTREVETYDFEYMEFDVKSSTFILHTGVASELKIIVDSIDLTILQNEEPLGFEEYKFFLGLHSNDFFAKAYRLSKDRET